MFGVAKAAIKRSTFAPKAYSQSNPGRDLHCDAFKEGMMSTKATIASPYTRSSVFTQRVPNLDVGGIATTSPKRAVAS